MEDADKTRYSLKYTYPADTEPVWFNTLGEVYLALEDGTERFCEVKSEDGASRYVGRVSLVKANIAWKLLNIQYGGNPPTSDKEILKKLERKLKNQLQENQDE